MPLFSSKNNTISDKDYKKLQDRARKAEEKTYLSKKAADRRKANSAQLRKSRWS